MQHRPMVKKIGMVLLAASASLLLSSCLVEKDKAPQTIDSTETNLRIYQPSNFINYNVRVDDASGTQSGTLQVKWDDIPTLTNPLTAEQYNDVLKETTTLIINSGTPQELVRYIEQAVDGSMYLRAFDSPDFNEYYWLSPQTVPTASLQRFEIFRSPLAMPSSIDLGDFYVVGDCTGTECPTRIAYYSNRSFQVTSATETVTITGVGVFTNVYKIEYNGILSPEATTPLLDILDACGTSGTTTHSATLYVAPEIGIIQMTNSCIDSSPGSTGPVFYTITLDYKSF